LNARDMRRVSLADFVADFLADFLRTAARGSALLAVATPALPLKLEIKAPPLQN